MNNATIPTSGNVTGIVAYILWCRYSAITWSVCLSLRWSFTWRCWHIQAY